MTIKTLLLKGLYSTRLQPLSYIAKMYKTNREQLPQDKRLEGMLEYKLKNGI